MTNIALASSGEIDQLEKIDPSLREVSARRISILNSIDFGHVFIARYERIPVGFVEMHNRFYGNWFIELLYVRDGYRGKGIGTLLLSKACQIHKREKLFSSTNESNQPMRNLFASNGFVQSGYIENLDEGDPELVYFRPSNAA